jgi:hypothetical protein
MLRSNWCRVHRRLQRGHADAGRRRRERGRSDLAHRHARRFAPRPDAVAWISDGRQSHIATANEGDLFGGSRGFSIFDAQGHLVFDSGVSYEEVAVRHGHYPEDRSEKRQDRQCPSRSGAWCCCRELPEGPPADLAFWPHFAALAGAQPMLRFAPQVGGTPVCGGEAEA